VETENAYRVFNYELSKSNLLKFAATDDDDLQKLDHKLKNTHRHKIGKFNFLSKINKKCEEIFSKIFFAHNKNFQKILFIHKCALHFG
jgi:hemerythrin superfamily protein